MDGPRHALLPLGPIIAVLYASSPKESKALLDFLDFFFRGTSLAPLSSSPSSGSPTTFLFPGRGFCRPLDEENDRLGPVAFALLATALPGGAWFA